MRSTFRVCLCVFAISSIAGRLQAAPLPGAEEKQTAREMQAVLQELDASKAALPWEEYVALLYMRLQGREPSAHEFGLLCALNDQFALTPSEALSVVLRGALPSPSYEQIQAFLDAKTAQTLVVDDAVRAAAKRLALEAPQIIAEELSQTQENYPDLQQSAALPAPDPPNLTYNTYFGYLHAHCNLSDGQGTALEAYTYARDVGKLDFFALTDHSELMIFWPWENNWEKLRAAADATDAPGSFAALYGFEWSSPYLGHFTVVNSEDFTSVFQDYRVPDFYRWLVQRPEAIGRFNHPGDYDFIGQAFQRFALFPAAVPQMVGMELYNENRGFDAFYYRGSWDSDINFYDLANLKGWQVGALGGQDNHVKDWGTKGPFRTAVLAQELTREAILDAYRQRRFYSTEDQDLRLDFRCAGYPMGAHLQGVPRSFEVTASDGSGDNFEEVRLYRNGLLFETHPVEGNSVEVTFEDNDSEQGDSYYVIVRETDDADGNGRNDEAISSPIWIDVPPLPAQGCTASNPPNEGAAAAGLQGDFFVMLLVLGVTLSALRRYPPASKRR